MQCGYQSTRLLVKLSAVGSQHLQVDGAVIPQFRCGRWREVELGDDHFRDELAGLKPEMDDVIAGKIIGADPLDFYGPCVQYTLFICPVGPPWKDWAV